MRGMVGVVAVCHAVRVAAGFIMTDKIIYSLAVIIMFCCVVVIFVCAYKLYGVINAI